MRRSSVAHHCQVVKEKAVMRAFYRLGELMMERCLDPLGRSKEVASSIQEAILQTQTVGGEFRRQHRGPLTV